MTTPEIPQRWQRAFDLAYFIFPERKVALEIATRALSKLEVAANAQFKRLYYEPSGRSDSYGRSVQGFRTKVVLEEAQLLQRLIYIEAEPFERAQERRETGRPVEQEDMVIRFIKHLVRITLRRTSFYVNLAISRLLHDFTTSESMDLYGLVVQDPERVRNSDYYRSRKKQLMEECQQRFKDQIEVERGYRGELRFTRQESSGRNNDLVKEALQRFTPWDSACVVPQHLDVYGQDIPQLAFHGQDPDGEHAVEVNRMHTVLHPKCFQRLTLALGLGPPEQRLAVPAFHLSQSRGNGNKPRNHITPPRLSPSEAKRIRLHLTRERNLRKSARPGILSVLVDGQPHATLDLSRARVVELRVSTAAEVIEIRNQNGLLLGTNLITGSENWAAHSPRRSTLVLESGQRLVFEMVLEPGSSEGASRIKTTIGYQEMAWAGIWRLWWLRQQQRFAGSMGSVGSWPVWVSAAFAGLAALWLLRSLVSNGPSAPLDSPQTTQTTPSRNRPAPAEGLTRSPGSMPNGARLGAVTKIAIMPLGDSERDWDLKTNLEQGFRRGSRFSLTADLNEADAVIKNLASLEGPGPDGQVPDWVLVLVNAEGEVLWRYPASLGGKAADTDDLARDAVEDLLAKMPPFE